jgi:hypothetical protein
MATKSKLTGKGISTEDVLRVVGDGATFAQMATALGLTTKTDRALDRALQRERRAGRIRFDRAVRLWCQTVAGARKVVGRDAHREAGRRGVHG